MYAWARDNYAINHFTLFSFLVSLQIFSFQLTWAVSRKTTRFSRRISYRLCIDDSWFSIDLPQCVLTDNTTGTLMYVVNFKDINLSLSVAGLYVSPVRRARLALRFFVDRFHDWWFQLIPAMLVQCCCILRSPYHSCIYISNYDDDYVAEKKCMVDESELNHLMRHSIMADEHNQNLNLYIISY